MPRTSPIHYISPADVSITPNANGSANGLAVYIAGGTKIKVYYPPILELGTDDASYQEWTLTGRNRRLADSTKPYTIYARLSKTSHDDAYLVFASMEKVGEEWRDPYVLSPNTSAEGPAIVHPGANGKEYTWSPLPVRQTLSSRADYWWVKVGTVSATKDGMRTVDLDTGILGTDEYNVDWDFDPDGLPLRIELACRVNGKEMGTSPYVYWEESLDVAARLVEGWSTNANARVQRWTIARNSGNPSEDAEWNSADETVPSEIPSGRTMPSAYIRLSHKRDDDDFAGAVASIFTITAWGYSQGPTPSDSSDSVSSDSGLLSADSSSSGEEPGQLIALATTTITVWAETLERYELILSTGVMAYDPTNGTYNPKDGIDIRIRVTDQRGEASYLTRQQFANARLGVYYALVGSDEYTLLTTLDPERTEAKLNLSTEIFGAEKSVNLRLGRIISEEDSDSDSSDEEPVVMELAVATVAYVRNGEDSNVREWIYFRSATTDYGTHPNSIEWGEVSPDGVAGHVTRYEKHVDEWVPEGWTDDPQGVNETYRYEFESYRDYMRGSDSSDSNSDSSEEGGYWGPFTKPVIRFHLGKDGGTPESRYQWGTSPDSAPSFTPSGVGAPGTGWSATVPNRPSGAGPYYLWMITAIRDADGNYGPWGNPVRLTGDKGEPGEDADDREWIYIGDSSYRNPYAPSSSPQHPKNILKDKDGVERDANYIHSHDDFVPLDWSDTAIATDPDTNKFVYASWRDKQKDSDTWGDFQDPILWSNWGVQGIDGDGVQYIYKLFDHELSDAEREAEIPDDAIQGSNGEWMPQGTSSATTPGKNSDWSDDVLSPTPSAPFSYCSVIKKINGEWQTLPNGKGKFNKLGLWSVYTEGGLLIDLDNQMDAFGTDVDGVVLNDQTMVTHVKLFYGLQQQTISSLTARVCRADGTEITDTSIVTKMTDASTGTVSITVKKDATLTSDLYADITAQRSQGDSRSARFSLKHVSSSAPGVSPTLYQLLPSMTSIPFAKNSAGDGYTPSQQTVKCGYTETTGTTPVSHPDDVSTGSYNIYYRKTANGNYTKLTTAGVTVAPTDSFVEFILCANTEATVQPSAVTSLIDVETVPVVKDGLDGEPGNGIVSITRTYAVSAYGTTANDNTPPEDISEWLPASPPTTTEKPYLWAKEVTVFTDTTKNTTKYYCIGEKGENGIDAKDVEWAYIRTKTNVAPVIYDDEHYTDSQSRDFAKDDHLPRVNGSSRQDIETNSGTSDYPECTDDPKGVNEMWQYEWEIKRTKGAVQADNSRSWNYYAGTMTLHNNYAESALVVDIENDNDQFGTDSNGVVTPAPQVRATEVAIYFGSQAQELNADNATPNGITASLVYEDDSAVPASVAEVTTCRRKPSDNTKGEVAVTIKAGTFPQAHSGLKVNITVACAMGSRSIAFTLQQVKSGAPGVSPTLYQLNPTPKSIPFQRDASNNLIPNQRAVTVNVLKTVGNTTTEKTSAITGVTYDWGFDDEAKQNSSPCNIGTTFTVTNTHAASHHQVWIKLSTGDAETLPIVKDGVNGSGVGIDTVRLYRMFTVTFQEPEENAAEWIPQLIDGSDADSDSDDENPNYPTEKDLDTINRYLWQKKVTSYTAEGMASTVEISLLAQYIDGTHENLLEDTAFLSMGEMEAWQTTNGTIYENAIGSHNAFQSVVNSTAYLDILKQRVYRKGELQKLKPDTWYTLSFYGRKGEHVPVSSDAGVYNGEDNTGLWVIEGSRFSCAIGKGDTFNIEVSGKVASQEVCMKVFAFLRTNDAPEGAWEKSASVVFDSTTQETKTITFENTDTKNRTLYFYGAVYNKSDDTPNSSNDPSHRAYIYLVRFRSLSFKINSFLCAPSPNSASAAVQHSAAAPWYVDGKKYTRQQNTDSGDTVTFGDDGRVLWNLTDEFVRHSVTFKTVAPLPDDKDINVLFRLNDQAYWCWICMPKLEEGTAATEWIEATEDRRAEDIQYVYVGPWVYGTTYYYGGGTGVRHVVRAAASEGGSMTYFRMRVRTTSEGYRSTIQPYADTEHWEEASYLKFVATDFLLAENAIINFASTNRILVTNAQGTVVAGMGGASGSGTDIYPLWVGGVNGESSPFKVNLQGKLFATGAELTGTFRTGSDTAAVVITTDADNSRGVIRVGSNGQDGVLIRSLTSGDFSNGEITVYSRGFPPIKLSNGEIDCEKIYCNFIIPHTDSTSYPRVQIRNPWLTGRMEFGYQKASSFSQEGGFFVLVDEDFTMPTILTKNEQHLLLFTGGARQLRKGSNPWIINSAGEAESSAKTIPCAMCDMVLITVVEVYTGDSFDHLAWRVDRIPSKYNPN